MQVYRLLQRELKFSKKLHRNAVFCLKNNSQIQWKTLTGVRQTSLDIIQPRCFHTTPKKNVPPIIWIILKPVTKIVTIIYSRKLRKRWTATSLQERELIWQHLGGRGRVAMIITSLLLASIIINYIVHLKTNPLTGRRRYICLTSDQIFKAAELEEKLVMGGHELLPVSSAAVKTVENVVTELINANKDILCQNGSSLTWTVNVIDDEDTENAFVMPNGSIYVFTGILKSMDNVDQLAVILGHEMAHAIMEHTLEQLSHAQMLDFIMIALLAVLWTVVPGDGIALVTQWFTNKLMELMFRLPYSRELESEADDVGMRMAAKACYDVREGLAYWAKMYIVHDAQSEDENSSISEWLSTHPSNYGRALQLQNLLPQCLELRRNNSCRPLTSPDPVQRIAKTYLNLDVKQD